MIVNRQRTEKDK